MKLPLFQVDAFTDQLFRGNPAAVCPLDKWLPDETLQAIAAENNLAETAYFVPSGDAWDLRWFTPTVEIDLCGHATLASAFVIMNHLDTTRTETRFQTRSGELRVTREADLYSLDFPSRHPQRREISEHLVDALGARPLEFWAARDCMAVYATEQDVLALRPNMEKLVALGDFAFIATAPGSTVDFVSRFFAPGAGIPEDPVTGSAHCTLTPYWAGRLGKTVLTARQVSARGGELLVEQRGDRVKISGKAVLYLTGTIYLPD
jgi:PhzF family phenazine biosynthesis protein